MDEQKHEERKLALHEYPRDFTEEQLAKASELMAMNYSYAAVSRELGLSIQRATTLCKKAEVLNTALRLRETKLIPDALIQLQTMTATMQDMMLDLGKRLTGLETAQGRVAKAMVLRKFTAERDKATIKKLRNERKELRDLIRKRGIV